jgi:uncharacterized protein YbaR (Trm112 family)
MSETQAETPQPISDELLKILVCPVSKKKVALSDDKTKLVCQERCQDPKCPREYPIENGIPRMLVED